MNARAAACLSVLLLVTTALAAPQSDGPAIQVRVDPRVELLSTVFRLAGNPEYGQGKVDAYTKAVEEHFGPHRQHAVVRHAQALRRSRGVSYDAVMSFAIHLDERLRPAQPFAKAARLDERWPDAEANRFAEELRDFARDSKADAFFATWRPQYEQAAARMQAVLDQHARLQWFEQFFGARPTASFQLVLGMLNGGACYGPSVLRPDGTEQLYCVLGVWATDDEGQPRFDADMLGTVVHEFCHSWCNALADAHADALRPAAEQLWPHLADQMRAQAYGTWQTMLREALVRACVVRYQQQVGGDAAARREIDEQHRRGFPWTGELAELLGEYERDRQRYPRLDAFMPRVVAFFADYAPRFVERLAAAPRVVGIVPHNGAADVDPATTAIVVTFDRPMRDGAWAVVGGGPHFPETTGRPSYDAERKVLTIPVKLKPDWDYELWLNRGRFDSFQSQDGVKLQPVKVTFRTRGA